jgi:Aromatic amino acid lyase
VLSTKGTNKLTCSVGCSNPDHESSRFTRASSPARRHRRSYRTSWFDRSEAGIFAQRSQYSDAPHSGSPYRPLASVVHRDRQEISRHSPISFSASLELAGIAPLCLEAKEGLALLNGTQGMLALLVLALREIDILADTADVAAALSLDALRGTPTAFDDRIASVRSFPGHRQCAQHLRLLNAGSSIRESHRSAASDSRVQDPYSLRCTPQVHGAVRDHIAQIRATLLVEVNAATDNPLVFAETSEVLSGGNFHGQPLAMAADQMAISIATLAGLSGFRAWPELGLYDPARRRGGARERDSSDVLSSLGRFRAHFGQPGRLCVDGDECRPATLRNA